MLEVHQHREEIEYLLAQIRQGEGVDDALRRLVHVTYGKLTYQVMHQLAHEGDLRREYEPADIVHRVMERLEERLRSQPPETAEDLVRLANRNVRWTLTDLARQMRRRRNRERPLGEMAPEDALATSGEGRGQEDTAEPDLEEGGLVSLEECERFHQEAASLPGRPGEVFRLRYYNGLAVNEIAKLLDVVVKTVYNNWQAALDQLSLRLTGRPFQGGTSKRLSDEAGER